MKLDIRMHRETALAGALLCGVALSPAWSAPPEKASVAPAPTKTPARSAPVSAPPASKPAGTATPSTGKSTGATTLPPKSVPTPPAKPKYTGPVWSVAFSPDGKTLAVGGYRAVRLYDPATGQKLKEFKVPGEGVRSLAYSPDGKMLAAGTGVPGQAGAAFVLDAQTGATLRLIQSHADTVESVAFASTLLLTAADDERVFLTDTASGQAVGKLTEHNGRCLAVAVPLKFDDNMGGEIFVTGGADNMVKVWDSKVRRVVVNFDQCQSPVWSLAVRPPHPGRFVTGSGDGRLRYFVVYRDNNGKPDEQGIWPRGGHQEAQFDAHEGGVYAVAVAPNDGCVVTGGADKKTVLWSTGGGKRRTFSEAEGDIWGVAIAPDNATFAAASLDGKTRLYSIEKQKLLLTLDASGVYNPPVMVSPSVAALLPLLPQKPASGSGLTASYFNDREGTGKPALVRVDEGININVNSAPPAEGINRENIFVRWEGFVEAPVTGEYRFWGRTDDGMRLWLGGKQVIDSWYDRGASDDAAELVRLKAGERIPIKMEYYQGGGGGEAGLTWEYTAAAPAKPGEPPGKQERQPIPKIYLYPMPSSKNVPTKPSSQPKTRPEEKRTPRPLPAKVVRGG